ncbi:MAG TPA: LD-carboxypeptidase [Deltaproteobacteria bacterium]|nr:LD-carboxypeptidase [Deltaproteobacteria bacterium]
MAKRKPENQRPLRLKEGDAVGIVAPASHFDPDTFHNGIAVLESMGFNPVVDGGLYEKENYFAGPDEHRADLINRYFADEKIKAIICARGGFGSIRILSLLDFQSIQANPKCFVGFSDITAVLSVLSQKCKFPVFHGPNITTLAKATQKTKDAFYSALAADRPVRLKTQTGIILKPGTATGQVTGGNLTTLCHLLATPYQPDFSGRILLLEDTSEAPYRVDRMLSQMKLAGCFDTVAGLVLGTFRGCGRKDEIYRIAVDAFQEYDMPVLAGLPVGHGRSNLTVPMGLTATMDTDLKELMFHEPATV